MFTFQFQTKTWTKHSSYTIIKNHIQIQSYNFPFHLNCVLHSITNNPCPKQSKHYISFNLQLQAQSSCSKYITILNYILQGIFHTSIMPFPTTYKFSTRAFLIKPFKLQNNHTYSSLPCHVLKLQHINAFI